MMKYKITITFKDNSERVLDKLPKPTAGTFWSLLERLEKREINSFNITLSEL